MSRHLRQSRIVDGHQHGAAKLSDEPPDPDSADGGKGGEIQPVRNGIGDVEVPALGMVGDDDPKQVDDAHDHDGQADFGEDLGSAFGAAAEQENEGDKKVKNDQDQADCLPAVLGAIDVEGN